MIPPWQTHRHTAGELAQVGRKRNRWQEMKLYLKTQSVTVQYVSTATPQLLNPTLPLPPLAFDYGVLLKGSS